MVATSKAQWDREAIDSSRSLLGRRGHGKGIRTDFVAAGPSAVQQKIQSGRRRPSASPTAPAIYKPNPARDRSLHVPAAGWPEAEFLSGTAHTQPLSAAAEIGTMSSSVRISPTRPTSSIVAPHQRAQHRRGVSGEGAIEMIARADGEELKAPAPGKR